MLAEILDGQATARTIRAEVAARAAVLKETAGLIPRLAAVLVGDDPASEAYVASKAKACKWVGIESETHRLPANSSQEEVERLVDQLNADARVSGILVQHPIPKHLDETAVLARLLPEKDVDGISRSGLGALITGEPAFVSCTPLGIIELLDRYGLTIEGKRAVVVGRSIILGKPVALLLLNRNATVTICHSKTPDLGLVIREADILVAAVGRPELIIGDMIKPGAVVLDAGYNSVEGRPGTIGDVHFDSANEVASWITPVPGGVGPMTIAMLLRNTLEAAERHGNGSTV